MKRQYWTVVRRSASHDAAERRWDRAYLLLLSAPVADPAVDPAVLPAGTPVLIRPADARTDQRTEQ